MQFASLAQLERSHRRHDEVMAGLLDAARRLAAGRAEPADLAAIHGAVDFFERAVTRHFLDEEGSVFPRLSTRRPELAEALAALSAEHPVLIGLQGEVAAAARELDGETRPGAAMALLAVATRLDDAHRAHVDQEDRLFAGANESLTSEDDAEIVAEMGTRRDREGGGGGGGGGGGRRRREAEAAATAAEDAVLQLPEPVDPPAATAKKPAARPKATKSAAKGKAATKLKKPVPKAKAKAKKPAPKRAAGKAKKPVAKPKPSSRAKPRAATTRRGR